MKQRHLLRNGTVKITDYREECSNAIASHIVIPITIENQQYYRCNLNETIREGALVSDGIVYRSIKKETIGKRPIDMFTGNYYNKIEYLTTNWGMK